MQITNKQECEFFKTFVCVCVLQFIAFFKFTLPQTGYIIVIVTVLLLLLFYDDVDDKKSIYYYYYLFVYFLIFKIIFATKMLEEVVDSLV